MAIDRASRMSMVVVASYADPSQAERAAACLRRSGIECTVDESACSGLQPHWSPEHGGFNVLVSNEAVMTALSILQDDEGDPASA